MISRGACLVGGRRASSLVAGRSVPRQFAFRSQTRLLSNISIQHPRLLCRHQDVHGLPGSSRSFWWSSSKSPAPTTPAEAESVSAVKGAEIDSATLPNEPLAETATTLESTNIPDAALVPDASVLPDSPVDPLVSSAADALSNLPVLSTPPPPLNYGDLAALGLAGWSPIGLCQLGIEALQVFTGMPWFWTIIGATLVSRVALFPFTVMGLRNAAKMAPHQPEFLKLRDEIMEARKSKDTMRMNRSIVKQQLLYKKIGVSVMGMFVPTIVQIPVTLGMFFGIKRMCDLPLEQLKYSGFSYLPDLTVTDPTWILPLAATALINIQLSVSARDMTAANPSAGHMINLFRGISVLGLYFMAQLPSGVLVYLLTVSAFMSLHSAIMRLPAVRSYFGIPVIPPQFDSKPYTMLESIKHARNAFLNANRDAKKQAFGQNRILPARPDSLKAASGPSKAVPGSSNKLRKR